MITLITIMLMMLQHRFSRSCRVSFRARLLLVHAFAEPAPLVHDQPAGGHRRHRPSQRRGGTPPSRGARREETAPLRALPNRRAYASVRVAVQSRGRCGQKGSRTPQPENGPPGPLSRHLSCAPNGHPFRPAHVTLPALQRKTASTAKPRRFRRGPVKRAARIGSRPPKKRNRAGSRAAKPRRFSVGSSAKSAGITRCADQALG